MSSFISSLALRSPLHNLQSQHDENQGAGEDHDDLGIQRIAQAGLCL